MFLRACGLLYSSAEQAVVRERWLRLPGRRGGTMGCDRLACSSARPEVSTSGHRLSPPLKDPLHQRSSEYSSSPHGSKLSPSRLARSPTQELSRSFNTYRTRTSRLISDWAPIVSLWARRCSITLSVVCARLILLEMLFTRSTI